jgi:RNA polymerase sigma-32 factor
LSEQNKHKASTAIEQDRPETLKNDSEDPASETAIEDSVEVVSAQSLPIDPTEILDEPISTIDLAEQSDSKAVTSYDALSVYLREVRRIPKLTLEEESYLTQRYFEDKDLKAAYKLVQSNLWLVVKIAREYNQAVKSVLDLIQEGNIGLMEAVKNFNPHKGARLPSYAVWWIRAYIVRYLIANWRLVKLGTTQAQRKLFFNLYKERERLEREGFRPEAKLIAEKLDVRESDVIEMQQRLGSPDVSVDAPLAGDSDFTLHCILGNDQASLEDALASDQLKQLIHKAIVEFQSTLKPKDQTIFKKRLLSEEKATLQELSDELNISRERVRQIETRLIERFKNFVHSNFDSDILKQFEFLIN